ncbi:MAG: integrase, partial [Oxalobacteraceae bacterium]
KDKVEAAYNRSEQLTLRRELLEEWGELLTQADILGTAPGPQIARCSRPVP